MAKDKTNENETEAVIELAAEEPTAQASDKGNATVSALQNLPGNKQRATLYTPTASCKAGDTKKVKVGETETEGKVLFFSEGQALVACDLPGQKLKPGDKIEASVS